VVINTEYYSQQIKYFVDEVSNMINKQAVFLSKYDRGYLDSIDWKPENDYGFSLTQIILDAILNRTGLDAVPDHFRSGCTHILTTNADNLYSIELFGYLSRAIESGHDVIGFNSVSHHIVFRTRDPKNLGAGEMDLGAGVVAVEVLRKMQSHFVNFNGGVDQYYYGADGKYWSDVSRQTQNSFIG